MEPGLEDGVMLAEMADEEGDEAALEDARAQLKAIKNARRERSLRRCCPARRTATTPIWK